MIDLNELKKMAEAATLGPWRAKSGPGWAHTYVVGELVGAYEQTIATIPEAPSKTAQFIAAANPAAIIELIALASAAQDSAPAELPIKTWQERLREKFPETTDRNLFTVGHIEHAMEAEIADLRATLTAAPASPSASLISSKAVNRVPLNTMKFDDGKIGWYFDTEKFYIDIEQDIDGKYSIYFRSRDTKTELWVDEAELK